MNFGPAERRPFDPEKPGRHASAVLDLVPERPVRITLRTAREQAVRGKVPEIVTK